MPEFSKEQYATLAENLAAGVATLELTVDDAKQANLMGYLQLLSKWNKAFNLTAVRDPMEMLRRHLFDSLVLAEHLRGGNVLDVGSGAGLPGLPLAIMQPSRRFTLLDSNGKKTRFLQQVALELKLKNVTVEQNRAEAYTPALGFSTVTARAVAEPLAIFDMTQDKINDGGQLLVMAGPNQAWPEAGLSSGWACRKFELKTLESGAYRGVCIAERLEAG